MPGSFDVSFHPVFNGVDITLAVGEIIADIIGLAASYEAAGWGSAWLLLDGPATVLDTG